MYFSIAHKHIAYYNFFCLYPMNPQHIACALVMNTS